MTNKYIIDECYKDLATAIVFNAIKEEAIANRAGQTRPAVIAFFKSQWCEFLSGMDYNKLIYLTDRYRKENLGVGKEFKRNETKRTS